MPSHNFYVSYLYNTHGKQKTYVNQYLHEIARNILKDSSWIIIVPDHELCSRKVHVLELEASTIYRQLERVALIMHCRLDVDEIGLIIRIVRDPNYQTKPYVESTLIE